MEGLLLVGLLVVGISSLVAGYPVPSSEWRYWLVD
jgi:hypothetical protein